MMPRTLIWVDIPFKHQDQNMITSTWKKKKTRTVKCVNLACSATKAKIKLTFIIRTTATAAMFPFRVGVEGYLYP